MLLYRAMLYQHIHIILTSLFLPSNAQLLFLFFFFNDTATTEIYTLSLHDALPISHVALPLPARRRQRLYRHRNHPAGDDRSEEHTSELQSQSNLVCRLLLEKKKKKK